MFYIKDPSNSNWSVALTHKKTKFNTFDVCDNIEETPSFTKGVASLDVEGDNDSTLIYVRDNCDGE